MIRQAELADYDGLGLAELVSSGQVSAVELAEASIVAASELQPKLNFIMHDLGALALEVAHAGTAAGPFQGVPFVLKDLVAEMAGTPISGGSRLLHGAVSAADSTLVRRFKAAGLVIIAKTTTAEFGTNLTTEGMLSGATLNPWNPEHSAGGSSGGSAVAVATGVVAVAHGNDGIGSIRVPAANCGLFGLKPTRARTPAGPIFGEIGGGRAIEFALSRTVRDSAALLDCVQGPEVGAPYWAPPCASPFAEAIGIPLRTLRIGLIDHTYGGSPIDEECAAAARDTAALCEAMGHVVEVVALPIDFPAYLNAIRVEGGAGLAIAVDAVAAATGRRPSPETLDRHTWLSYEEALGFTARDYLNTREVYASVQRRIGKLFETIDLLITPMLAKQTAPIGWLVSPDDDLDTYWSKFGGEAYSPFTGVFNVTGQPAASVPLHMSRGGLPIGTQLVGRFGEETTILALAAQFEVAAPWAGRRPPIHVTSSGGANSRSTQ